MRDFEFDDSFWAAALAALRGEEGRKALASAHPDFVEFLDELTADAARERILVGLRFTVSGKNPRLLALLLAAHLARAGTRTVLLDLSPELRWLEYVTGQDLKEGLVDHLQYDIPLERCVRSTELPGLSVITGGAYFLAGSPLDNAPAFRAALDRLKRSNGAVVVALSAAPETVDPSGFTALCDALVTVEEEQTRVQLVGCERAVFRLTGDPQAAWDLARLSHRFLGPLPALWASSGARPGPVPELVPAFDSGDPVPSEELAFLADFERARAEEPVGKAASTPGGQETIALETASSPDAAPKKSWPFPPAWLPRGPRGAAVLGGAGVVALVVLAFGVGWLDWLPGIRPDEAQERWPLDAFETGAAQIALADAQASAIEPGSAVSTASGGAALETADETAPADPESGEDDGAGPAGFPMPYSLHVGSYQNGASGMRLVERVVRAGHTAFLAPVAIPGKGLWHRVYIGVFADSASARSVLDQVLEGKLVEEGAVRQTPYAFRLGTHETPAEAREQVDELRLQGVSAYVVGDGPVHVYAGAFQTPGEAELFGLTLRGVSDLVTLTERER